MSLNVTMSYYFSIDFASKQKQKNKTKNKNMRLISEPSIPIYQIWHEYDTLVNLLDGTSKADILMQLQFIKLVTNYMRYYIIILLLHSCIFFI